MTGKVLFSTVRKAFERCPNTASSRAIGRRLLALPLDTLSTVGLHPAVPSSSNDCTMAEDVARSLLHPPDLSTALLAQPCAGPPPDQALPAKRWKETLDMVVWTRSCLSEGEMLR